VVTVFAFVSIEVASSTIKSILLFASNASGMRFFSGAPTVPKIYGIPQGTNTCPSFSLRITVIVASF
jgi:hypothetical protein